MEHLAKVFSWCDHADDCVCSIPLDIDGSRSKSEEAAAAINNSCDKVGPVFDKIKFWGQTADSGSGGTLWSLFDCSEEVGVMAPGRDKCTVTGCALHALQLGFANGMKAAFSKGGLEMHMLLQLPHGCCDLQLCFPGNKPGLVWAMAADCLPPEMMLAAVSTHWWHVNTACKHLELHWGEWHEFATRMLAATKANTETGQIASSVLLLMGEPVMFLDLLFANAFSDSFFVHHFEWLQAHDAVTKDHRHCSRDMLL